MRIRMLAALGTVAALTLAGSAFATPHLRRGPTAQRLTHGHASKRQAKSAAFTHLSMSTERATELQTALIKAGYMTGTPTGEWDGPSQAAMEKLQGDNGWQTKLVPDSRAIIKLGLGPNANPAVPKSSVADPGDHALVPTEASTHPVN